MHGVTKHESRVLGFIEGFSRLHRSWPTEEDIARYLQVKRKIMVNFTMSKLIRDRKVIERNGRFEIREVQRCKVFVCVRAYDPRAEQIQDRLEPFNADHPMGKVRREG